MALSGTGGVCATRARQREIMSEDANPWSVPVAVAQIPEAGLHRDFAAGPVQRQALAQTAGVREIAHAEASLNLALLRGGRVHVAGHVRARIGQTCVVTLD